MSEQQTKEGADAKDQKPQLPSPDVAYQNLFDGVHQQVFFGKLASHGIQPQTEKEAQDLLLLAGRLRHVDLAKSAGDSRFGEALSDLDAAMGQEGFLKQAQEEEEELAIKEAAAQAMADPTIYNSVLSLKAHEASMALGQGQQKEPEPAAAGA